MKHYHLVSGTWVRLTCFVCLAPDHGLFLQSFLDVRPVFQVCGGCFWMVSALATVVLVHRGFSPGSGPSLVEGLVDPTMSACPGSVAMMPGGPKCSVQKEKWARTTLLAEWLGLCEVSRF